MTGSADMTATIVATRGVCQPALQPAHLPRPAAHDAAFTTALRLLATWAVRAASDTQAVSEHLTTLRTDSEGDEHAAD